MIAKRIPARTNGRGFGGLARYIVDATGRASPDTWTRTADYILDSAHDGAKVSGVRVTNCDTDDAAIGTAAVLATQNLYDHRPGRKSQRGRCYHLVISFPPGERPAADVLRSVEDRLVDAIGYADHQRLSAVHNDTGHLHIHVAINKVHPRTLRNVEPYYDKARLMKTCDALELRFGLVRTDHGTKRRVTDGERSTATVSVAVATFEAHGGRESLTRWVRENARGALLDAVKSGTWPAVHAAAALYGLTVKPRGAGMVIVDDASGTGIKASAIDRVLSAKSLASRLGTFQPRDAGTESARTTEHYRAAPLHKHAQTGALWSRYQHQRNETLAVRATARVSQRDEHATYVTELRQWYREKSAHLKLRTDLNRSAKREAWQALFAERAADFKRERERYAAQRKQVAHANPLPTWQTFLSEAADAGNADAKAVLRSRQRKQTGAAQPAPISHPPASVARAPTTNRKPDSVPEDPARAWPVHHKTRRGR